MHFNPAVKPYQKIKSLFYTDKNRRTIKNGSFHRPYTYAFIWWHKETTKRCFSTARKKSKNNFQIGSWRDWKLSILYFYTKPMKHKKYVLIFTYSRPHCCFNKLHVITMFIRSQYSLIFSFLITRPILKRKNSDDWSKERIIILFIQISALDWWKYHQIKYGTK